MECINDKNSPAPCGAYSHSVRSGNTLYISGQVPFDPTTGSLVGETIEDQTTQTLKNMLSLLSSAGLGFDSVVKTTVYLTTWDNFAAFNAVYARHMDGHKPARATIAVGGLVPGCLIEIEAIAEMSS